MNAATYWDSPVEFFLELETELTPDQFREILLTQSALSLEQGEDLAILLGQNVVLSTSGPTKVFNSTQKKYVNSLSTWFRFKNNQLDVENTMSVGVNEHSIRSILQITFFVLEQDAGDAYLILPDDSVVLKRVKGHLILNEDWMQWPGLKNLLAEIKLPYKMRSLTKESEMPLQYDLDFANALEPDQVLDWLIAQPELKLSREKTYLRGPGVLIECVRPVKRAYQESWIEQEYGFAENTKIIFTINRKILERDGDEIVIDELDQGEESIIKVAIVLLNYIPNQAALHFNGSYLLLQRTPGRLLLNRNWEQWNKLAVALEEANISYELFNFSKPN